MFQKFLNSLKTPTNTPLIETIQIGYNLLFESQEEAQKLWKELKTESPYFKKWFGNSKIVNTQGKPLVVYHGTTHTDITVFKPQNEETYNTLKHYRKTVKNNEKFGYMNFRSGSFFSPHPEYAGNYTNEDKGVMYAAYIKAENPIYQDQVTGKVTGTNPEKTADALILHQNGTINEIAVIEPTHIKSAIGNIGTFDPNNPDITK